MSENRVALILSGIFLALTVTTALRADHGVLRKRPTLSTNAPKELSKAQLALMRDAVLAAQQIYDKSFSGHAHWVCHLGNDGHWHVEGYEKCGGFEVSEEFRKVCLNTIAELCDVKKPSYPSFRENAKIAVGENPEPDQKLMSTYYATVAGTQAGTQAFDLDVQGACSDDISEKASARGMCDDVNSYVKETDYSFTDSFQTTFASSCTEALDYLCLLAKPKKESKKPAPWH